MKWWWLGIGTWVLKCMEIWKKKVIGHEKDVIFAHVVVTWDSW
jgi:hypothetical protein